LSFYRFFLEGRTYFEDKEDRICIISTCGQPSFIRPWLNAFARALALLMKRLTLKNTMLMADDAHGSGGMAI
jgi:hypothetical protein